MRHRKSGRRLGRNSAHRKAMFRNMVTSLMLHGRIRTTEAKAKELRRLAERVITIGKQAPASALNGLEGEQLAAARSARVASVRRARLWVNDRDALAKVFGEYADRFSARPGGYTRILKLGYRSGDDAPMALIELVDGPEISVVSDGDGDEAPVADGGEESEASAGA